MRCSATSRAGTRCKRGSIPGGRVCHYHGGAAPQVKQKAAERLAALVDPAITSLGNLIRSKSESIRLAAVRDVLDRNGHKPPDKHQLSGPGEGPIAVDLSRLTDKQLDQLEAIARSIAEASVGPLKEKQWITQQKKIIEKHRESARETSRERWERRTN